MLTGTALLLKPHQNNIQQQQPQATTSTTSSSITSRGSVTSSTNSSTVPHISMPHQSTSNHYYASSNGFLPDTQSNSAKINTISHLIATKNSNPTNNNLKYYNGQTVNHHINKELNTENNTGQLLQIYLSSIIISHNNKLTFRWRF